MGLKLSPESERLALEMTLAYAAKRWPDANRVTHPQLMREIEDTKEALRRAQRAEEGTTK